MKLNCSKLHSSFACNFNLRPYIVVDNCVAGKSGLVYAFVAFIVDELGWLDACGVLYFWPMHGKA